MNIYRRCSQKATDYFIKNKIISGDKKAVYEYGFEILISTLAYTLLFILISLITNTILESLVFLVGFFVVRTIAGGYHANTYLKCHILSVINHIVFVVSYHCVPEVWKKYICLVVLLVSSVFIIVFAPVDHPNKPFVKTEKKRFRILSICYGGLLILIALISFLLVPKQLLSYLLSYVIGTFSATVSIVVAKINLKKGKKLYEEH